VSRARLDSGAVGAVEARENVSTRRGRRARCAAGASGRKRREVTTREGSHRARSESRSASSFSRSALASPSAGASVAVVGGIFSATGASPRAVEPTAFGDTIGAVARVGADSTFSSAAVFCLSAFPRRARGARGGIAKARRDAPPDASPPRLGMAARARSEEAGGTFRIVVAVGRLASAGK